jgi:hypothetical protein
VYNRQTFRLGQKGRENAPNLWIRAAGVLEPIVEPNIFLQAQAIKRNRRICLSERELLARLSSLFREKGKGAVRDAVGIRFGAFSENMKVSFQATRSIG